MPSIVGSKRVVEPRTGSASGELDVLVIRHFSRSGQVHNETDTQELVLGDGARTTGHRGK